jgi:hypothetical protein
MIWHYYEAIYPYTLVLAEKLETVYYDLFIVIFFQYLYPIEAGGCEEFDAVLHD